MADRPHVWLVSAAWRRYPVTRIVLAQRAHLARVLADHGIDCSTVIIADDDNLDLARSMGAATVEMANDKGVGRKFNAGFQFAAREGATHLVHIGSDDWLHPDALLPVLDNPLVDGFEPILTGTRIAFVDLAGARLTRARVGGPHGVIPWVIPRRLLESSGFAPIRPDRNRGLDGFLIRGLRHPRVRLRWRFHDPHEVARVDFKSDVNINPFAKLPPSLTRDPQVPWPLLMERYPVELVEMARRVHLELSEAPVPRMKHPETGDVVSVSKTAVPVWEGRGYVDARAGGGVVSAPTPVAAPEAPARTAKRAEWDEYARTRGVDPDGFSSKDALIEALESEGAE